MKVSGKRWNCWSNRTLDVYKRQLFCSPEPGFSIFTADKKELDMHMIDKKGKVIYTVTVSYTHQMCIRDRAKTVG